MLASGDGPQARRLVDYLEHKLDIEVGIEPVLTQNLDQALDEMSVSRVDVAIPANRINRDLVGGDWVQGTRRCPRAGPGWGRPHRDLGGSPRHRNAEDAIRRRIRELIDNLRGSGALSEFEVRGSSVPSAVPNSRSTCSKIDSSSGRRSMPTG